MYSRYAEIKAWKVEILNPPGMGGFEISFKVAGDGVYNQLKFRAVFMRQRVPGAKPRAASLRGRGVLRTEAVDIDIDETTTD